MSADNHDQDPQDRILDLLAAGAEDELRLLRKERKAERRLADALSVLASDKARLQKVQKRIERSRDVVAEAEARLREVQANRATGPIQDHD